MIWAPSACSRRAMAAPMRRAAPVIRTTFPVRAAGGMLPVGNPVAELRILLETRSIPVMASPVESLPAPSTEARIHGERVVGRLREAIGAAGGWLPFARFMEISLYSPGLGYYSAGARKLGRAGDFVTAPELSPLFGQTLAR